MSIIAVVRLCSRQHESGRLTAHPQGKLYGESIVTDGSSCKHIARCKGSAVVECCKCRRCRNKVSRIGMASYSTRIQQLHIILCTQVGGLHNYSNIL